MKKIFVLLCAVVLFAVACEKEYPPTADVIYNAVTDYDGNSYDAVRIGNQVWMALTCAPHTMPMVRPFLKEIR